MDAATDDPVENYKYLFQPNLLKGHVAFITGGGSGIGFTITEILMRHGCDTVIASRRQEKIQKSAETLMRATGRRCIPIQADVRKPQDIMNAVDKTLAEFGRLDILVNSAAGNFLASAASMSVNAFRTVLDIDTVGTFNASKVAYEKYFRDHGGVIVNISATLPYRGQLMQSHAGPAKAAIDALTKHLAVEWGGDKVRVVGLAPGSIDNTVGVAKLAGSREITDYTIEETPVGRLGTKVDIAHAVLYMASEIGSFITGETLVVDGGLWLTSANSFSGFKHLARSRMSKM